MCRGTFGIKGSRSLCVCVWGRGGGIGRCGACFCVGYCVQLRGGWIPTAHAEWP